MGDSGALRNFRAKFELSQNDFAQLVGLSSKAVSNIEIGFRKPGRPVLRLVELLNSVPQRQARRLIGKYLKESKPARTRV